MMSDDDIIFNQVMFALLCTLGASGHMEMTKFSHGIFFPTTRIQQLKDVLNLVEKGYGKVDGNTEEVKNLIEFFRKQHVPKDVKTLTWPSSTQQSTNEKKKLKKKETTITITLPGGASIKIEHKKEYDTNGVFNLVLYLTTFEDEAGNKYYLPTFTKDRFKNLKERFGDARLY